MGARGIQLIILEKDFPNGIYNHVFHLFTNLFSNLAYFYFIPSTNTYWAHFMNKKQGPLDLNHHKFFLLSVYNLFSVCLLVTMNSSKQFFFTLWSWHFQYKFCLPLENPSNSNITSAYFILIFLKIMLYPYMKLNRLPFNDYAISCAF